MQFSIFNSTQKSAPRIQFEAIKNEVLSKQYELSLAFIGRAQSRKLNRTYRGKDKTANVLAFPLSKTSGEIFICLAKAKTECRKFDMSYKKYVTYLFIHALLHLKGMEHGDRMSQAEEKFLGEIFPRADKKWLVKS